MTMRKNSTDIMSRSAQLRRNYDILYIDGTGTIAFCLWSIMKAVLLSGTEYLKGLVGDLADPTILVAFVLTLLIDSSLRLFVGIQARQQGTKQTISNRNGFLVCAGILAFTHILSACSACLLFATEYISFLDMFATCVIDVSCFFAFISLINATLRIRKLTGESA